MEKNDFSKKINDCLSVNKNNQALFDRANILEKVAEYLAIAIFVVGIIVALTSSFQEEIVSYYSYSTKTVFKVSTFFIISISFCILAALEYGTVSAYVNIIRCMAETSQNTLNIARLTELQIDMLNNMKSAETSVNTGDNDNPQSNYVESTEIVSESDKTPETVINLEYSDPTQIRLEIEKITAEIDGLSQFENGTRKKLTARLKELEQALNNIKQQ